MTGFKGFVMLRKSEVQNRTACGREPENFLPDIATKVEDGAFPGITDGLETFWLDEARRRHIRLPSRTVAPTPRRMEKWLRRLGMSVARYYELSGTTALRQFAEMNPGWMLVAWVGIILEWQSREAAGNG